MPVRLFVHALGLILRNALHVLKIVLLPALAYVAASVLLGSMGQVGGLLMGLVQLVIGAWIGTNWFPFILRERYPGWVPDFEGPRISAYIAAYFPIVLSAFVIDYAFRLAGGSISVGLFQLGLPASLASLAPRYAAHVLELFIYLRLGLALPAAALGRAGDVMESWRLTSPLRLPVLLVAAVLAGVDIVFLLGLFGPGYLGLAVQLFWQVISLLLPLALVTSLYGLLVEGRRF